MTELATKPGLPTRQHERWKYANLHFLKDYPYAAPSEPDAVWVAEQIKHLKQHLGEVCVLVMVNGEWRADLSDALPLGCEAAALEHPLVMHQMDVKQFPLLALQQAEAAKGLVIQVNTEQAVTIHLLNLVSSQTQAMVNPSVVLELAKHAHFHWVEHVHADNQAFVMINQFT